MAFSVRYIGHISLALVIAAHPIVPNYALANPSGGTVTGGSATITGEGTSHTIIDQTSQRAFIEWQSFDVGTSEIVDFNQPSASAITANKVTGLAPSEILGRINANGRIFIINGNGVVFGENSVIDAAGLMATTHNLSLDDFMSGDDRFSLSGGNAAIIHNGNIAIRDHGFAALLAPQIVNNGVITARLGEIALASSQAVTIDFHGDSLLSFAAYDDLQSALTDDEPLINQQGILQADGGTITMTTRAASDVLANAVNLDGITRARSVAMQNGRIILSATGAVSIQDDAVLDASGGGDVRITANGLSQGGTVSASGTDEAGTITFDIAGQLSMAGRIEAVASAGVGGDIALSANHIIENQNSEINASGRDGGGTISVISATGMMSSGDYNASSSNGAGGRIDMTAEDLRLLGATLDASGQTKGGIVRVGGAFQGGKTPDITQDYYDSFVGRWPTLPSLRNAGRAFINDGTDIIVSSDAGVGGTAIIWSDDRTTFLGSVNASGSSGGSVEISSAATLRHANLSGISVQDGYLLLDPKNITIGASTEIQSWSYQGIIGSWYSRDVDPNIDAGDEFGSAVALSSNGQNMAVGAWKDDGASGGTTDAGAVYLYTFSDGDFNGATLRGTMGKGYTGTGNVDVTTLEASDNFGSSVALDGDGDKLAVGIIGDDGNTNGNSGVGAVRLYTFTDTNFSGGSHVMGLGRGYDGMDITQTGAGDQFGISVALNNDGNMLAVGAPKDSGPSNSISSVGAVYLISFTNTSFGSPTLRGIIGDGYSFDNSYDFSALTSDDRFGRSVAFNGNGMRLAVGASRAHGSGNSYTNTGDVYIFGFENEMFKTPTLKATIGQGYSGTNKFGVSIGNNDFFGRGLAMNDAGTRLAVGAPNDDGHSSVTGTNFGAVYLLSFDDDDYSTMTQEGIIGRGYTGSNDLDLKDLNSEDVLGNVIAMNSSGTRMALGIRQADGQQNGSSNSGALKFISFDDSDFDSPTLLMTMEDSAFVNDLPNNDYNVKNESFGYAVALDGDGDRLAVSTIYDTGNPSTSSIFGAIHLYSFTDTNYSGAVLEATIGRGYTGGKNINHSSTNGSDFGKSISLNSAGDRLAVGEEDYTGGGAAHLFTFTDTSFTGGSLAVTIADGASNPDDIDVTLGSSDRFGAGVSLSGDGTRLAVGATGDDGSSDGDDDTGAVYLFTFTDTSFGGGQHIATIGSGYTSGQDEDVTALSDSDFFGRAVSLDYDGNRLAVGANGDEGPDAKSNTGAVYLFSFDDTSFTNGSLTATIGDGYTGDKNVNVTNLSSGDAFGVTASLNAVGDRLAVGAYLDDGSSGSETNAGAVYIFSFSDDDFSSGTLRHTIGSGYNTGNDVDVATLEEWDYLGISVDFNDAGDRLAAGAHGDNARYDLTTNAGAVYLFSASHSSGGYPSAGQTFSNIESSDATLNAYEVADLLTRGTNLTLQASNDITVSNAILVGTYGSSPGDLTLQAGRSIIVNDHIRTEGGDINLYANDTTANGVVNAQRDSGDAVISLAATKYLNANSGDVNIHLRDGTGKTNTGSGDISLAVNASISGNAITIHNEGPTSGSDITLAAGSVINGGASGDAIILAADNVINNSSSSALNTTHASGRYQIWSGTPSGTTLGGLGHDYIHYNATYGTTTSAGGASENGVHYTYAPTVTADFTATITKTYDGDATATVANSDIGVTGAESGETVVLNATSAAYNDASAGSAKRVTLSGLNVASASKGAIDVYGYQLTSTGTSNFNGVIQRAALNLTGQTANNKTYDASTTATISSYGSLSGVIGDDVVTLDSSGATALFDTRHIGTNKTVTITSLALSGDDGANYAIGTQTTSADITAKQLTLASATANNKTYNATSAATIASYGAINGIEGSEVVNLDPSSSSASFSDANAATGKTVTISGLSLTGADASNYTIADYQTTADITRKALSITAPTAADKTYDASTSATITQGTLSGFVNTETVTASASGTFSDANVGDDKTVTVSYTLANGDNNGLATNYSLADDSITADIDPATLTISAPSTADKTYDGDATATVTAGNLSGLQNGETLTVSAAGTFSDVNVGDDKTVTVNYTLGNDSGLASNYTLADGSDTADINRKALSISAPSTADKTYDGDATATVTAGNLSGLVNSETLTVSAAGAFSDANAGDDKTVTVTYTLGNDGGLASNYSLADGSDTADINRKALTISAPSTADKTYDGDATATVTAGSLSGLVNSETLTVSAAGTFSDANVGDGKTVTVSYTLGDDGGLANNYSLADGSDSADIDPATLTISAPSTADKTYDGDATATVTAGNLSGLQNGETLTVSAAGTFSDANAGDDKTVTVTYTLGNDGGLASNYTLADGSDTADINRKALGISAPSVSDRDYNGSSSVSVTAGNATGLINSETLNITASGSMTDANVGTNKTVTVSYNLANGTGLASNYTLADGTTAINITRKALSITAPTAADKTYDASTSATITQGTLSGFVNTETVTASATGTFSDANVGDDKAVSVSYSLANGNNNGLASNYSLADDSITADIDPAILTIAGSVASDKTYDATVATQVAPGTLSGLINSETIIVTASGQFSDADIGTGKSVAVSYSLADGTNNGVASNYSLSDETLTADINKRAVTISGLKIDDKAYDGTTSASFEAFGSLNNIAGSDAISLNSSSASAQFANANVGTHTITLSALTLSGVKAGNYELNLPSVSANINPKALSITGSSAEDKEFDNGRQAIVTAGTLSGFIGSQTVLASASGLFENALVGANKKVTISYDLTNGINGGLASNYSLANEVLFADITGDTQIKNDELTAPVIEKQIQFETEDIKIEREEKLEIIERVERFDRLTLLASLEEKQEAPSIVSEVNEATETAIDASEPVKISDNKEIIEETSPVEETETKPEEATILEEGVIEAVGDWSILSCQSTSTNKGICSIK